MRWYKLTTNLAALLARLSPRQCLEVDQADVAVCEPRHYAAAAGQLTRPPSVRLLAVSSRIRRDEEGQQKAGECSFTGPTRNAGYSQCAASRSSRHTTRSPRVLSRGIRSTPTTSGSRRICGAAYPLPRYSLGRRRPYPPFSVSTSACASPESHLAPPSTAAISHPSLSITKVTGSPSALPALRIVSKASPLGSA